MLLRGEHAGTHETCAKSNVTTFSLKRRYETDLCLARCLNIRNGLCYAESRRLVIIIPRRFVAQNCRRRKTLFFYKRHNIIV